MSEVLEYECDTCGHREAPGTRVVGWIALAMATMDLPGSKSTSHEHVSNHYCSEVCARIGLDTLKIPTYTPPPLTDLLKSQTQAMPEVVSRGQYL